MKLFYILLFVVSALMIGCSPETEEFTPENDAAMVITLPGGGGVDDQTDNQDVGLEETVDLIAGQNIDVGSVTVTLDGDTVIVTYETDGDWSIDETHLFVGDLADLPTNGGGNPRIGHFPHNESHTAGTTTVIVSTIELLPGECAYVAAHAVVGNSSGQEETAWGDGEPIGGNNWSMMFEVCR